jgi:hypothetical protein
VSCEVLAGEGDPCHGLVEDWSHVIVEAPHEQQHGNFDQKSVASH